MVINDTECAFALKIFNYWKIFLKYVMLISWRGNGTSLTWSKMIYSTLLYTYTDSSRAVNHLFNNWIIHKYINSFFSTESCFENFVESSQWVIWLLHIFSFVWKSWIIEAVFAILELSVLQNVWIKRNLWI